MKFLLIGCNGKMGKTIARLAEKHNDIIVCGLDLNLNDKHDFKVYQNIFEISEEVDAIIDFSTTEDHSNFINYAVMKNIAYGLFSTLVNEKTRTTLKEASKHIPILFCKNASVGVNLIYKLIEICAKTLNNPEIIIQEYHHKQKLDKPSGTAKDIEQILSNNNLNYETHSYRVSNEAGTHIIQFFLEDETITLIHSAKSRDIFAHGAILAMHKLKEKENNLYFSP